MFRSMLVRSRTWKFSIPAALGLLALAACGGGGGGSGGGDSSQPPASSAAVWDQTNWNEKNWQ